MFGEGESCTQKMRRDSSGNEVPQPKALKAGGKQGLLLAWSVLWRLVQDHGGRSGELVWVQGTGRLLENELLLHP